MQSGMTQTNGSPEFPGRFKPQGYPLKALDDATLQIDKDSALAGSRLYTAKNCIICHGTGLKSAGAPAPDLRESTIAMSLVNFKALLKDGMLAWRGMPRYSELSDAEVRDLFMYIRAGARDVLRTHKSAIINRSSSKF